MATESKFRRDANGSHLSTRMSHGGQPFADEFKTLIEAHMAACVAHGLIPKHPDLYLPALRRGCVSLDASKLIWREVE